MRKPRDFDAELKALDSRAQQLKSRKLVQFGELVIATGADGLAIEELAGAMLAAVATVKASTAEASGRTGTGKTGTQAGTANADLFGTGTPSPRTTREDWRKAGAAFFQRRTRATAADADRGASGSQARPASDRPAESPDRAS
jgi:DNA-binding protein H-NS